MIKKAGLVIALSLAFPAMVNAKEYVVQMKFNEDLGKLYFEPQRLEIKSGDTVTWVQKDDVNEHNVAAYPNGIPVGIKPFESPMMSKVGQNWSMTFTKPGTYAYHCHPHEAAGMKGLIVVDRESRPEEMRKPQAGEMEHSNDHGAGGHKH